MSKNKSYIEIYALLVNIVAVVAFLICVTNLISSSIDKGDPLHSSRSSEKYASFEAYKLDAMRSIGKDQAYIPTNDELRAMYDTAVSDNLLRILHGINRSLTVNSVILILSILLFIGHWILMKKTAQIEE